MRARTDGAAVGAAPRLLRARTTQSSRVPTPAVLCVGSWPRKEREAVERKLLEALESGEYKAVTPEVFDQLRARVADRAAENKKTGP